tara:strand:+ start:1325 stop:1996 length:672 start_codon:yes stop_codon:yes gene_type:complete
MRLLSWDIGVHNLSYCLLEKDDSESGFKIIDWDIIDVSAKTKKTTDILYNIPIELDKRKDKNFFTADYVLIENQPSLKNPKMKSVQMGVYCYFLMRGMIDSSVNNSSIKDIIFVSARCKLTIYDGPEVVLTVKSKYTQRKKLAIAHTKYFLKHYEELSNFMISHKKKDDLCDSFLQALYYLKVKINKEKRPKKPRKTKKKKEDQEQIPEPNEGLDQDKEINLD